MKLTKEEVLKYLDNTKYYNSEIAINFIVIGILCVWIIGAIVCILGQYKILTGVILLLFNTGTTVFAAKYFRSKSYVDFLAFTGLLSSCVVLIFLFIALKILVWTYGVSNGILSSILIAFSLICISAIFLVYININKCIYIKKKQSAIIASTPAVLGAVIGINTGRLITNVITDQVLLKWLLVLLSLVMACIYGYGIVSFIKYLLIKKHNLSLYFSEN